MKFRETRRGAPALLLLAALSFALQFGCGTKAADDQKTISAMRSTVETKMRADSLVGVSVAAFQNGRMVLAEGFGLKDMEKRLSVEADTMFAIGSITKQFTSACVLLLAQDGKLNVMDKVARYYPDLTRAEDITLLDLMNHVSGYPDYYPLDFVDRPMMRPTPVDEVIGMFCKRELDFEPGTRYSYSNTGFLILGRIVEKVSGRPLGEFMAERIFGPLGMTHTFFEPGTDGPEYARGYSVYFLSAPEPAFPEAKSWVHAAGALYSTPSDLVLWDEGLFGGKLLKPEYLAVMTAPRRLADGSVSNYACGIAVGKRNGVTVYNHTGAVNGFYAFNFYVPSTRTALVLCANLSVCAEIGTLFNSLADLALYEPAGPKPAEAVKPAPAAGKDAGKLKGPAPKGVPEIAGPATAAQAGQLLEALQAGRVDRAILGDEFNYFLTDRMIERAAAALRPYGRPANAFVESINERGGMEVSSTRFGFGSGKLRAVMYRTPDGKVQQFFVQRY